MPASPGRSPRSPGTVDEPPRAPAWRTVLTLFTVVVGAVLGPGVAQAAPLEEAAVVREAAVFANLDSLSPPIVTTLEPGRDVAHPACRRDETDMVFIRWAPRRTLPGPQDVGSSVLKTRRHASRIAPAVVNR